MLTELVTPFLTPEPSREEDDAGCMNRITAILSAHLSEHIAWPTWPPAADSPGAGNALLMKF